ncbi:MFS transporter [Virgisporangium aurantiacum]|uniref:MFS transporter n=1 Tax=Virgisporangium aurantiacum TaxID=175570 RepID=A0A8J4E6C8_9ACTN|nr:MFS transporter [Virgisporangium aurantiacum]GIJ63028.1 MFS transporter [Virgisporangium aurantiacum]
MKAGRREWIGLAVLALPTLLLSLDVSVLYLALPQLSAELGADSTEQLWILDIYSFLLAGFLVTMGTLGDRIGRRRLLLVGAFAFAVASLVAAFSTSPEMLIVARAALGVAGATLMPSTMALIRNMFSDPKEMGTAIGIWFACFMGGMTLGPLAGGLLVENYWWGSAFLLGVPVMVLLLVTAPFLLPEYRDPNAGRLDLASVGLSLGAILPAIFGLKTIARDGLSTAPVVVLLVGVVVGWLFARRQRTLADPFLDLSLFTNRTFSGALSVMLFAGVVMAGVSLMSSLYLQVVDGRTPLQAGLLLIPQNIAMVVGSVISPMLGRRFQSAYVIAVGLALAGAGLLVHTVAPVDGGVPYIVGGLVVAAFGIALPMGITMNVILGAAPPEKAGSAASISETSGEFGIAMGIATLGSLATVIYRGRMDETVPGTVPGDAAATANESVTAAAAAATAATLPGEAGAALLGAAREAFTGALHGVAWVGAGVFLALAVVAVALLRSRTPAAPEPSTAEEERQLVSAGH